MTMTVLRLCMIGMGSGWATVRVGCTSFKMMLMLEWSELREGNCYLNDTPSRLMFSRGSSNNNKPNWWNRMRKKMQIQFLCPWSNQILNPPIPANNNKRSKSVCIIGTWSVVSAKNATRRWMHTKRIWYNQSQIDLDACATKLSAQLHRGSQLDTR